jgi:type I restriction enzyme S subunit
MKIVFEKNITELKRIGDIVNFKRGYDLPAYARVDGEYPVMSSSGVSGYHNEFKIEGEGLVTGRYGTLGEFYYVNGKYWPHNTALYVTDFKGNYPKYVYFLMKSLSFLKRSDKSTVPGIDRKDLHEIKIPYIKGEQQKLIADALFLIEEKIALNNDINTELENLAKTIYNYWFVQFDFPNEEGKPYKTSGGEMVWNEELKREIPKGWEVDSLKRLFEIQSGYPFKSEDYRNNGKYKLITIKNVQEGFLDTNETDFIETLPENLPDYYKLKLGDLLISLTGNVGRVCIVTEENLLLNQRVGVVIPRNQCLAFTYFTLQNDFIVKTLNKIATGSNQKNLSPIEAGEVKSLQPDENILKLFEKKTKPFFDMILKNQRETQELIKLRDFLLPLLMNGQVKVKSEATEQLSMAAEPQVKYGK